MRKLPAIPILVSVAERRFGRGGRALDSFATDRRGVKLFGRRGRVLAPISRERGAKVMPTANYPDDHHPAVTKIRPDYHPPATLRKITHLGDAAASNVRLRCHRSVPGGRGARPRR